RCAGGGAGADVEYGARRAGYTGQSLCGQLAGASAFVVLVIDGGGCGGSPGAIAQSLLAGWLVMSMLNDMLRDLPSRQTGKQPPEDQAEVLVESRFVRDEKFPWLLTLTGFALVLVLA